MILQQITKIVQRVTRVLLNLQMDTQTCCFGSSNLKTQKPVRFPNCCSLENKSVYNVIHQNLNWLKQLLTVSSLPLINFVSILFLDLHQTYQKGFCYVQHTNNKRSSFSIKKNLMSLTISPLVLSLLCK